MLPAVLVDIAQRVQKTLRVTVVTDARFRVDVLDRINAPRALPFSADDPARLVRRVSPRECDQLFKLFPCDLHCLTVHDSAANYASATSPLPFSKGETFSPSLTNIKKQSG